MHITLYLNDPQRQLEKGQIKWIFVQKQYIRVVGYYLLSGVVVIAIGWDQFHVTGFWNLASSLAIGAFYIALNKGYEGYRAKKRYFDNLQSMLRGKKDRNDVTEMTIDDEGVRWHSQLAVYDLKWPVFTHFMLFRNYLFLYMLGNEAVALEIDQRDMRPEEFAELTGFVRTRLHAKGVARV